jgi:CRISPR-associated protein Cas1
MPVTDGPPELIPARMLNEFAYCPRLAYLEWVESEFAHNDDTLDGRFAHRRVDRPDGRPALDLDLAEEFRPLVAESAVLSMVNAGELTADHFVTRAGGCSLTDAGRKVAIAGFERRLDQLITHPIFGYRISYRRVFEVQARLLARVLAGEIARYPNFLTR